MNKYKNDEIKAVSTETNGRGIKTRLDKGEGEKLETKGALHNAKSVLTMLSIAKCSLMPTQRNDRQQGALNLNLETLLSRNWPTL